MAGSSPAMTNKSGGSAFSNAALAIVLLGPRAVAQSKMAVRLCGESDLTTARNIGLENLAMLIGGPEWQEGMAAFMEKREPRFPPL